MNRSLHLILVVLLAFAIQACTERLICPAYQSAFIHDEKALEKRFSYFGEDSLPKVLEASKDRFLIIEPMAYRKKLRSLQTVPMTDVYPEVEDSVEFADEFYLAERDLSDSLAIDSLQHNPQDSIYVISLKKEKFNIDQELYLWYLKDYLVYPDVRLLEEGAMKSSQPVETKEKKGFFKRLFGGKKHKNDSTVFDVETNATDIEEDQTQEKKGIFNFLKKKKKKNKDRNKENPEEDDPLKPEENQQDPPSDPSTLPLPGR